MESSSNDGTTQEEDNSKGLVPVIIIPTDQAWVVVLVSFYQNFLIESVPLTMLLIASDLPFDSSVVMEDKYFIAAFFFGLSSFLTPISCALINWYSFKKISIIGSAVISISMVLTYFTQEYLICSLFFLSIVGGFGNSMINATSICLPTVWFCNRRGVACHISRFGQSLGILCLPWFTIAVFIEDFNYSVGETYLLYAGMYLPLIALSFSIPKLHGISLQVQKSKRVSIKVRFLDQETATDLARSMSILGPMLSYSIFRTYNNLVFPRVKDIIKERSLIIQIPEEAMLRSIEPPYRSRNRKHSPIPTKNSSMSFSFYGVQDVRMFTSPVLMGYGSRPFYRQDIFFTTSVNELYIYMRQTNQLDYHMAVSRAMSRNDYDQEANLDCLVFPEAITRTLLSMLHIGVWNQLHFIVLQVALALCYLGYYVPFILTHERHDEIGEPETPILLITYIGFGHLTGCTLGFLFSLCCYDADNIFVFELILLTESCLTFVTTYFEEVGYQFTYCFFTGIFMSVSETVMVPSICRITGIFNLTNAIGYKLIFQGLAIIIGSLVCVNVTIRWSSVKPAHHIAGWCLFLSGLLMVPLKKIKNMSRERQTDLV